MASTFAAVWKRVRVSRIMTNSKNSLSLRKVPDRRGHFGPFGGRYVAETLMPALDELEAAWNAARGDPAFARELDHLFREYVGVKPKWVLERIRLHEAAERMADGESDWPALALDLGYFDQAHFIKAFKAVVGRSPADYALRASATVG